MISDWIFPIALVLIALAIFVNSRKNKVQKNGRTGTAAWSVNWSKGLPKKPTITPTGLIIRFGGGEADEFHYAQCYKPNFVIKEGMTLTARFRVTGGRFIPWERPDMPATMSLILQRKGDDGQSIGYRFFSLDSVPLVEGYPTLSVKVTADNIRDVIAPPDAEALRRMLREFESVGFMAGWDGGRGHGVYSTGPGSIELLSLNCV